MIINIPKYNNNCNAILGLFVCVMPKYKKSPQQKLYEKD